MEAEDGTALDLVPELDAVHGSGDEFALGIIDSGGHPGAFVNPGQHLTTEKRAVMIEMFRSYEVIVFHMIPA